MTNGIHCRKKSNVMKFLKSGTRPDWDYKLGADSLQVSDKEKDLGVVINSRLPSENTINEKKRRYMFILLANTRIAFTYVNEDIIKEIMTSVIRPTLEYCGVVWNPPHLKEAY